MLSSHLGKITAWMRMTGGKVVGKDTEEKRGGKEEETKPGKENRDNIVFALI